MNFTLPNLLSILRMGLVPLFVLSILDGEPGRALIVITVAGVTDLLDGFIARYWKQQSPLGAYLDPAADKLLLVAAYVVLAIPNLHAGYTLPAWISAVVITRDVVIVVVALVIYLAVGVTKFPPTPLGKASTAFQVATVFLVVASGVWPAAHAAASVLAHTAAVVTMASGVDYVVRANRMVG